MVVNSGSRYDGNLKEILNTIVKKYGKKDNNSYILTVSDLFKIIEELESRKCVFCSKIGNKKISQMMDEFDVDVVDILKNRQEVADEIDLEEIIKKYLCDDCYKRIENLNKKIKSLKNEEVRVLEFYRDSNKFAILSINTLYQKMFRTIENKNEED